jgi:hypothetical protein
MTTEVDFQTRIQGSEYNHRMYVDVFGDNELWLSMSVPNARTNMTLKIDQAKEMVEALTRIINHLEDV